MANLIYSDIAKRILTQRYLKRNEKGLIIEDIPELFERVSTNIASADYLFYGCSSAQMQKTKSKFQKIMSRLYFLPNSPALMNAGTAVQQLSACFVLPVYDSIEEIFDTVKQTAIIHKSGGGTGFDFSRLRAKYDIVKSTGGEASGPVSFMRIINSVTEEIKQGGKRRGANMGILRVDHPDILEFITCKDKEGILNNFNISVALTDEFMNALDAKIPYNLYDPKNGSPIKKLDPEYVFSKLSYQAWKNGEPGVIFIDRINKKNPTPDIAAIEATNPCGEQPLLPYESCILGSLNLVKLVGERGYDYETLGQLIYDAVHFLDNTIDMNLYSIKQIGDVTKGNRKIGLGVMGFADSLALMGISYDSDEALSQAEAVMGFIQRTAKEASRRLALKRGSFPNHSFSVYKTPMRNATVTTIAPTGTISMIADTSAGIEPVFGIVYSSERSENRFYEINPVFDKYARKYGFYSSDLYERILQEGSIQQIDQIPDDIKKLFITSSEISSEHHIKMQSAFQKHTDNAVSKTINFSVSATTDEIKNAFLQAYRAGCMGLTVYRDGSRKSQVLKKGSPIDQDCSFCSNVIHLSDVNTDL